MQGVGGAERVVHALAAGQRQAGHQVRVVAVLGASAGSAFLASLNRVSVETIPLWIPRRAYGRERSEFFELCRRLQPDVVHTHGYHVDIVDAAAARRAGSPTVTTVHGFTGGNWKNRIYERLQRRAFRRFDAVVAVSRPLAHDLERSGVPRTRLHFVANAWPADDPPRLSRAEARAQLGVSDDRFHIGWVGRLTEEKGADLLLAAVRQLGDVPLTVSVVGDGRCRPKLERAAVRLGISERVRWVGTRPEAARLFPAFDVFVLSSRTEGTPMVLFEAMAAGTPIVATAVGGVPDVVTAQEASLVKAGDAAGLAHAIRAVHVDPAAAAQRARCARERLTRDFGPGPWLARYESIYRSLR